MNRGSILHEDLTYAMLHEMVMKKFNLEAIYPLNLSAKVSSIDDNFDITDDDEVQFFIECACNSEDEVAHLYVSQHKTLYDTTSILENRQENTFYNFFKNTSFDKNGLDLNFGISDFQNNESNHQNESHFEKPKCSFAFGDYNEYEDEKNEFDDVVDDNPLTNYQKWQKYMSFKPDIPETPLYKLKALDEGYQFLTDRSAPERCGTLKGSIQGNKSDSCRHGWKQPNCANCLWYMQRGNRHAAIALAVQNKFPLAYHAAYTTEDFSSSISHLQDIQPDAYDKLCQLGPQRCVWKYQCSVRETYRAMVQDWYYKRRILAGICQCRKWQLSGLPCGHVIAVTRFTSPPRRSFVGGLVATVDPVELEKISTIQVKRILTYSLGYDENSATFLYLRKPNCSLDSGLVPLADALQDRNMLLTYAQSHQNRLHVYVSRVEISPLVVADQHKEEGSKKEKHGKPSCSKKLFD
ncbi:transposase, MuDR, MULE transposase domain protein [Tanacetum coccineum]